MSRIINFWRKANPTLRELAAGAALWGIVLELVLVWFSKSRVSFTLSLAAGVAGAVLMAVHMYVVIEDSLELAQDDAVKHMRKGTALRIVSAMALFVLAWRLHGSVPGMFFGLATLKLGAYTQPFLHAAKEKWKRNEKKTEK